MAINGISIINLKCPSQPNQITRLAVDNKTREVVGTLSANIELNKSYSGVNLPPFYVKERLKFSSPSKPHIYVKDLFVNESQRKKGIGKKLVEDIIAESKKRGFEGRVVLLAGNSREASPLPFYRKLGFSTYNRQLNEKLDYVLKYRSYFDNRIQSFMAIPKDTIGKILKSIQQCSKVVRP